MTSNEELLKDLTPDDFEYFRKAFEAIDKNGDGLLDKDEIKQLFQDSTHSTISDSEVIKALQQADHNDDGLIDFYEFVGNTLRIRREADDEICMKAFELFDKDKSGTIDVKEVKYLLRLMGVKVRSRQVDHFMKTYDVNGDGSISYDEFKVYYDSCIAPEM